ncbi:hypothetical protein E8E13_003550 [Curvularia kusanoi]|uniref:Uncharacterized protein n=1 Tax=Curvularia kusanoi TaxID=90978 RepID=A0A9P4W3Z6_CURKU|nr:hypothetical protein E8E13_003550 [Curvularia kusanoi]
MNVNELATELGAEPNLLLRLLRYAATQWMVEQVDVDAFRATDVTSYLCMSGLESVVFHVTERNIALYNALPKWLAENSYKQPQDNKWLPFNLSKNTNLHFFEWLSQRPRHQQAFNEYMSFQRVGQQSWLDAFPLEKYMKESNSSSVNRKLVVDVGGGYGHQCQEILKRYPGVRGRIVLQDTHMAAIDCAKTIEGLEVVHHDFTNAQPVQGACVYYLRNILHDWPDQACQDILRHLKAALASDSVILLDELVIQEGSGHWYGASFDLLMMANYGARERSLTEWDRILKKSGLERKEFIPYRKKCKFGAVITGLDLNCVGEETVAQLRQATWEHKLLIIKGQHDLEPNRGWDLLQKLDPTSKKIDNTTFARAFYPKNAIVANIRYVEVPDAGSFVFIGKGQQDDPRYGKPGLNMGDGNLNQYYSKPLSDSEFEAGRTRFHWWSTDGTFWQYEPPTFTMLRPIKFPAGGLDKQIVEWADGSDQRMEVKPGRTAFVDVEQLYDMLSDEEKRMLDHSWVEYMYWPYEWIKGCRGAPNGLGVASEGREVPEEEMEKIEEIDKTWQKKYPLVWVNPVTGRKSFQVQHNLARRLFIRRGPNDDPKVIDDVAKVRKFLDDFHLRIIKPEYIWVGPDEEQDLLLFQNYGLFHTKIDYPASWGVRTVHQGWLPGGEKPKGPVPIPGED